ncbi:hypothetical protein ACQJBY_025893 [Aegilops geniculata]
MPCGIYYPYKKHEGWISKTFHIAPMFNTNHILAPYTTRPQKKKKHAPSHPRTTPHDPFPVSSIAFIAAHHHLSPCPNTHLSDTHCPSPVPPFGMYHLATAPHAPPCIAKAHRTSTPPQALLKEPHALPGPPP